MKAAREDSLSAASTTSDYGGFPASRRRFAVLTSFCSITFLFAGPWIAFAPIACVPR